MFTYDFGYPWWLVNGHLIPLGLAGALAVIAVRRRWPRWRLVALGVVAVWALVSFGTLQMLVYPAALPSDRFLVSGAGRVLDVGAGSGRLAIGVLQAKPRARVTALDIYSGFFGILDNTPERLMANARAAGVADRLDWVIGDMREMPIGDVEYDAVVSAYAMDHVGRDGAARAVRETARVLAPHGEFLLMVVNTDWWIRVVSLLPHHSLEHPKANADQWRSLLQQEGFEVLEEGTRPGTLYFVSRKSMSARSASYALGAQARAVQGAGSMRSPSS
jgi:ubiquinone/menaquinone biosynthesis C-methylase UbiE